MNVRPLSKQAFLNRQLSRVNISYGFIQLIDKLLPSSTTTMRAMAMISSPITKFTTLNCGKPYINRAIRPSHNLFTSSNRFHSHIATSSAAGATDPSSPEDIPADVPVTTPPPAGFLAWWKTQQQKSAELRKKLVSLGPAAVLAYGMFDGVSYTIAFAIAFLGYEARTGLNPTANVADIIKICILMWAGNNVTRPFRLAGAAMLAPTMDNLMESLQKRLALPNKIIAFFMIVALVASICLSIVSSLFLSRWIQG